MELKVGSKRPRDMVSLRLSNVMYTQRVAYEWMPVKCPKSKNWGHEEMRCTKEVEAIVLDCMS